MLVRLMVKGFYFLICIFIWICCGQTNYKYSQKISKNIFLKKTDKKETVNSDKVIIDYKNIYKDKNLTEILVCGFIKEIHKTPHLPKELVEIIKNYIFLNYIKDIWTLNNNILKKYRIKDSDIEFICKAELTTNIAKLFYVPSPCYIIYKYCIIFIGNLSDKNYNFDIYYFSTNEIKNISIRENIFDFPFYINNTKGEFFVSDDGRELLNLNNDLKVVHRNNIIKTFNTKNISLTANDCIAFNIFSNIENISTRYEKLLYIGLSDCSVKIKKTQLRHNLSNYTFVTKNYNSYIYFKDLKIMNNNGDLCLIQEKILEKYNLESVFDYDNDILIMSSKHKDKKGYYNIFLNNLQTNEYKNINNAIHKDEIIDISLKNKYYFYSLDNAGRFIIWLKENFKIINDLIIEEQFLLCR